MSLTLRPYQEIGRDFLAARSRAFLADEMRVGKTPQAILACAAVDAREVLVVCPAIAVNQWYNEYHRWRKAGKRPTVVSYDRAVASQDDLRRYAWDVLIVDEAHFAKNPEAKRTKMVYGKEGLGWHAKRIWSLSGTPAPKHAAELWPMLRAFGAVKMTYGDFVARYCYVDPLTNRIRGTREKMIPELKDILAPVMLRRTRREVAPEMPDIDFQFLEIGGPHPDYSAVDMHEADESRTPPETRLEVAMEKARMLQPHIEFALENELLKQTVVFGWHVEPLIRLAENLQQNFSVAVIRGATPDGERQRVQEDFRAGKVKVICAQILAAGTAIDLSVASHGYFLELDWVPGNNMQAANRLISMDKAEPVTFDVVTWPGSIDERVQKVLLRRSREIGKLYGQEGK